MLVHKNIRKKFLFGGFTLLLVVSLIVGTFFINSKSVSTSCQADYPSLPSPMLAETVPFSLNEQILNSKLVVDASVIAVMKDEERSYIPEAGSAEAMIDAKFGNGVHTFTVRPVILKVNEILKGSSDSEITIYISPIALDCSPNFKLEDRLIFMLSQDDQGKYFPTTAQDGFYYISKDNKIYPAMVTNFLEKYSGISLNDFKNTISIEKGADK